MMFDSSDRWLAKIAGALQGQSAAVAPLAGGRWSVLLGEPGLRASVFVEQPWLCIDVDLPRAATVTGCARTRLEQTALLAGNAKYVLAADDQVCLRADLALVDGVDLSARLAEALRGLRAGTAAAAQAAGALDADRGDGENAESTPGIAEQIAADRPAARRDDFDLGRSCTDAGWPFTPREPDLIMVSLDAGGAFVQATVRATAQQVAATVPVAAAGGPLAPASANALAVLLLRAAASVRGARAALTPTGAYCLEAILPHTPVAEELHHALAAMSVMWRLAGREAAALARDVELARRYLALAARHGPDALAMETTSFARAARPAP